MLRTVNLISLTALLVSVVTGTATAATGKRVALVIGNAAYTNITPLVKPINDAQALAKKLRELGYEVILGINANKLELEKLALDFRVAVQGADVGLFYYSGHGFQTNGAEQQHPVNHVLPVDFNVEEIGSTLPTLPLDVVVETLKNEARVGLIFMDACRNDPQIAEASKRMANGSKSIAISRGLARVGFIGGSPVAARPGGGKGPTGLLIAYSTDPGNVALEGDIGLLSPFTGALVKHMTTPGLSVAEVMGRVSVDVALETRGLQTPWNVSSLTAGTYQFVVKPVEASVPSRTSASNASSGSPRASNEKKSRNDPRRASLPPNLGVGVGAGM